MTAFPIQERLNKSAQWWSQNIDCFIVNIYACWQRTESHLRQGFKSSVNKTNIQPITRNAYKNKVIFWVAYFEIHRMKSTQFTEIFWIGLSLWRTAVITRKKGKERKYTHTFKGLGSKKINK